MGSPAKLLDGDKGESDIESIAKFICTQRPDDRRSIFLHRLDTIGQLRAFFDRIQDERVSALGDCKRRHFEAIDLLNEVVSRSNENVCSDEKLSLLEDFHVKFISSFVEHVSERQQAGREPAAPILRLFFMHYAMEVSAVCKRNLINNLEWDVPNSFPNEPEFRPESEGVPTSKNSKSALNLFNNLAREIVAKTSVSSFEDLIMFWPLIQASCSPDSNQAGQMQPVLIGEMADPATGEPVKMFVKMRSVEAIKSFRRACELKYRPVYEKLILPIVRLADMGYSNEGEQFKRELKELKENKTVKKWYAIAQFCETIIPMGFYADPQLAPNESVMISEEEARQLNEIAPETASGQPAKEEEEPLLYEPTTNSMVGVHELESVDSDEVRQLVKEVRLNLSSRQRVIARAQVKMIRNMFSNVKAKLNRVFLSRKLFTQRGTKQSSQAQTSTPAPMVSDSTDRVEVSSNLLERYSQLSDEELMSLEGAAGRGGYSRRMIEARSGDKVRGIAKRKIRRRKGDVDAIQELRAYELSYQHTKPLSEIMYDFLEPLRALAPTRMQLLIGGSIITFVVFLVLIVGGMGAAVAAG